VQRLYIRYIQFVVGFLNLVLTNQYNKCNFTNTVFEYKNTAMVEKQEKAREGGQDGHE
jgi:hypothetical protein